MSIDPQLFNLVMTLREDRRRQEEQARAQRLQGLQTGLSFAEAGQLTPEIAQSFGLPVEDLPLLLGTQERIQQQATGEKLLPLLPEVALGIERGLAPPEASIQFSQQIARLTPEQQEQLGIGITAGRLEQRGEQLKSLEQELAAKDLATFQSGLRREEETEKQRNRQALKAIGFKNQVELAGLDDYISNKATQIAENPAMLEDEAQVRAMVEDVARTFGAATPAVMSKIESMAGAKMMRELSVNDHIQAGANERLAKLAVTGKAHRDKLLGRYYEGEAAIRDRMDARAGLFEVMTRYRLAIDAVAEAGGGYVGQRTLEDLRRQLGPEGNALFAQLDAVAQEFQAFRTFAQGGQQLTEHEIKLLSAPILTPAQITFVNGQLNPAAEARFRAVEGTVESQYLQSFAPEEREAARAQYRALRENLKTTLRPDFEMRTETLRNPEGEDLVNQMMNDLVPTQPTAPAAPAAPPPMQAPPAAQFGGSEGGWLSQEGFEAGQQLEQESGFPAFRAPGQVPSRAREIQEMERERRFRESGEIPPERMPVR